MVAAERERAALARADELVEAQGDRVALAEAEPADAGGQALQRDALARELDPAAQRSVPTTSMRTSSLRRRSSGSPVRQIQRNGPTPRARIGRTYSATKPGISSASANPCVGGLRAEAVAVLEDDRAALAKPSSAADVRGERVVDRAAEGRVPRVGRARLLRA